MSPATTPELTKSGPTGPRTEEGKQRSALNALRHGLTARTVVMPYEDMNAYRAFCEELMADLAPETAVERQYAQTFCDTQWRLNRIRSIEDSMFALGHFEDAGNIDADHPQVHAALTAARVFREDSKSFVNLSLYEQRLQRTLEKSLKQLQPSKPNEECGLNPGKRFKPQSPDPTNRRVTPKANLRRRPPPSSFFQIPQTRPRLPLLQTRRATMKFRYAPFRISRLLLSLTL